MTANPLIDQYAADVRKRLAAKPSTVRAENRRTAKRAANELAKDLPGVDSEQLGAVLLRVAALAHNLAQSQPGATVYGLAGLLDAAGEHLYHHPGESSDEPECETA